jgi:hypothetical protein
VTSRKPQQLVQAQRLAGFHADFRQMTEVSLSDDASVTLIKRVIAEIGT